MSAFDRIKLMQKDRKTLNLVRMKRNEPKEDKKISKDLRQLLHTSIISH